MTSQPADTFFAEHLRRSPVLVVLRGETAGRAADLSESCWDAGVELVEVSISGDRQGEALTAVTARAQPPGRAAGAGTVYTARELQSVAAAGATFAVAPGLSAEAVAAAGALGLPYLPGVATPSEVQAALALGCTTLKLFPAGELGPGWLRALAGPFPQARFVAVGGITRANAAKFMAAGAIGVGIGSSLDPAELPELLDDLRAI
jgi:Entner-Doudoroff aldolase